jgi:hypothetical protein
MAMFAVLIPFVMLGVVLALGRYEELLLPEKRDEVTELVALTEPRET